MHVTHLGTYTFVRSMFLLLMETFKLYLQIHCSSVSSTETEFGEISDTTGNLFPESLSLVAFPVFVRDFSQLVH